MTPATPPITEEDIVEFLVQTPDFFERHADLLAAVQLSSPHGGRAVSDDARLRTSSLAPWAKGSPA